MGKRATIKSGGYGAWWAVEIHQKRVTFTIKSTKYLMREFSFSMATAPCRSLCQWILDRTEAA